MTLRITPFELAIICSGHPWTTSLVSFTKSCCVCEPLLLRGYRIYMERLRRRQRNIHDFFAIIQVHSLTHSPTRSPTHTHSHSLREKERECVSGRFSKCSTILVSKQKLMYIRGLELPNSASHRNHLEVYLRYDMMLP